MTRTIWALVLVCIGMSGSSPTASADVIYSWTLSGLSTGSGQLTADAFDNIIAFSGVINGNPVELLGGQPGGFSISPSGTFFYDNILYPDQSGPGFLDAAGILLSSPAFTEANLFGDGATGLPGTYGYFVLELDGSFIPPSSTDGSTFSIQIPEPASLMLLAAALLFLMVAAQRGTRLLELETRTTAEGQLGLGAPLGQATQFRRNGHCKASARNRHEIGHKAG